MIEHQDSLDLEMRKLADLHKEAFGLTPITPKPKPGLEVRVDRLENDVWGLQINKQNKRIVKSLSVL